VAWWQLDDGTGEIAVDSSGNGFDGTITDANWIAPGHGDVGFCLEMDRGNYVDLGNPDALNFGTGDWAVTAWINTTITGTDAADRGTIYANGGDDSGGIRYTLCVSELQEGQVTLTCDDDTTKVQASGTTAVNDGEWHLVVGMREGTTIRVVIDGVFEGQNAVAAGYDLGGTSQHNAYIGVITSHAGNNFIKPYAGLIDDVRVFSRALTAGYIQDLYQGLTPSFYKAGSPEPADGDRAVMVGLFRWSAGLNALLHEVYLGTSPELTEADLVMPRSPVNLYFRPTGLEPGQTYYWRVDEIQADGTVTQGTVWSFMAQDLTAYDPMPADGAVDASPAPVLTWLPGQGAIVGHQVYFSDVLDDVNEAAAAADKGVQEEATFTPGDLESLTTYYWRVDELLAGDAVTPGPAWSFTTYLPVDDFESYNDDIDGGGAIFLTWVDGLENGTGAVAGYFDSANGTFNETTIVNGGGQSMPIDYNNINAPFYSEVERTWTPAQDWTAQGIAVLVLHVRGSIGSAVAPLYVALEDSSGNSAVVVHPDAEIVHKSKWTEWAIPLSDFTGVNLSRIKTMYIGVGDREAPTAGGTGRIFVDDIYLTR